MFIDGKPLLTKESARVAHSRNYFENKALLDQLEGFYFESLEEVVRKSCEKYLSAIRAGAISL